MVDRHPVRLASVAEAKENCGNGRPYHDPAGISQHDTGFHVLFARPWAAGNIVAMPGIDADFVLATPRLVLRPWRDSDMPLFAEQNADPVVMQFITGVLTREESDAYVELARAHFAQNGFCKWAVEAPGVAPFIGAVGLTYVKFEASFTPAVEVAWRLRRRHWGHGYATEAAQAAIADGFNRVGLTEIVSMTALGNAASMKVMERLGMARSIEFDHPHHPDGDPLRRHVLYRLQRPAGD